jgi:hypothetical protein
VIYDSLSVHIIKNILKEKEITTWKIAKSFNWIDKKDFWTNHQKDLFWSAKDALIRKRLKAMNKEGFVCIEKNSQKNVYIILSNKVYYQKKHKFPDCFSEALLIKEKNNKWLILQI